MKKQESKSSKITTQNPYIYTMMKSQNIKNNIQNLKVKLIGLKTLELQRKCTYLVKENLKKYKGPTDEHVSI